MDVTSVGLHITVPSNSPFPELSSQLCLDKLLAECSPSLDTVKMQVYFGTNHSPRRENLA